MKKLKEITNQLRTHIPDDLAERNRLLWQLICYPPKMPLRMQQEELLNQAEKFTLQVADQYFTHSQLRFNGFKWGNGSRKILITHGWGSKAADFAEMITALLAIGDVQVIAFDAPGNGSSDGELSNLLLFIGAVEAVITNYGAPDIIIGHSLGAMANVLVVQDMKLQPDLLISITPLIRLKENFKATMTGVGIPETAQDDYFAAFETTFNAPASYFDLNERYAPSAPPNHLIAYDIDDQISPYAYIKAFLNDHPSIRNKNYPGARHDRIIKSPELIADLVAMTKAGH